MTRLAVEVGRVLAVLDLVAGEVLATEVDLVLTSSEGGSGSDEGDEGELHCGLGLCCVVVEAVGVV